MHRIMIVEDDVALQRQLAESLQSWGYHALIADDFKDIIPAFMAERPDIVLLDINLPYYDGFYWCRQIREISNVPVLFLSSRDSNMDILMALNNGGDDYVGKPFAMPVLIGKIQALLRRAYQYNAGSGQEIQDIIAHNGLVLKESESAALYQDQKVELTRNELRILSLLIRNSGKIISRNDLMNLLWNDDMFVNDNTLTVNINRLRAKLEQAGLPGFISTKKGQGYIVL